MIMLMSLSIFLGILLISCTINHFKRLRRLAREVEALNKELDQFRTDHQALIQADLVFGRHLSDINKQLVSMDNQLQAIENKHENDGGYQHALHILEMGGNKEEIVNSCHLSNAEAELLMNLNAYREVVKTSSKSKKAKSST